MQIISVIAVIIALILAIIIVAKTIHFFVCTNRKKLKYWLYFTRSSIVNSSSEQSRKTKQVQNVFSVIVLCLVVLQLIVLMIDYKVTKA